MSLNFKSLALTLVISVIAMSSQACSPFYVLEAAYIESGILLRRKDIDKVIAEQTTSDFERQKLSLVKAARNFALELGLTPKQAFTKYSTVDQDVLAWVLMASEPSTFKLHTWWFPIVGAVPYKGYFNKTSAECAARRLEFQGYETFIRGTDAFSTLGWFNDPVLSTTLKHSNIRIVNTVIHESLHSTIWIPKHVAFNESLANFVGHRGALEFFNQRYKTLPNTANQNSATEAQNEYDKELIFASSITKLYQELDSLYQSASSKEHKLIAREEIFESNLKQIKQRFPNIKILQSINNSEIMQLKIYLTELDKFEALFNKSQNWLVFFEKIREIKQLVEKDANLDPFSLL